ncbi:MAG: hypothetical protein WC614_04565 [bacterium]
MVYVQAFVLNPLICIFILWALVKTISGKLEQRMNEEITEKVSIKSLPVSEIAAALGPTIEELADNIDANIPWVAKFFGRRWYNETTGKLNALCDKRKLEEILETVFDEIDLKELISNNATVKSNAGVTLNKIVTAAFPSGLTVVFSGYLMGALIGGIELLVRYKVW